MEFGFTNPVLVSDSGEIIAGHARVRAATQLGLDAVPCVILAHLTEAQRRAYVIADNKIALNSGWNLAVLAEEMRELEGFDFDLKITGFVDNELMPLLGRIEEVDPGAPTKEPARGSRELNESDFQKFDHKCPKCGFEYDET
jgi:ParB-like chromosome segregation protein Spo0J